MKCSKRLALAKRLTKADQMHLTTRKQLSGVENESEIQLHGRVFLYINVDQDGPALIDPLTAQPVDPTVLIGQLQHYLRWLNDEEELPFPEVKS